MEDDSFYVDLPNAAFSCLLNSGEVARAVVVLRAPSESDSDVAFEVEVLYASVPGAIECGGPAVRRNVHVPCVCSDRETAWTDVVPPIDKTKPNTKRRSSSTSGTSLPATRTPKTRPKRLRVF